MRRTYNEEKLTAYLLGELSDAENREVEDTLRKDPSTRQVLEELRQAVDLSYDAFRESSEPLLSLHDEQRSAVQEGATVNMRPAAAHEPKASNIRSVFDAPSKGGLFDAPPTGALFDAAQSDDSDSPFDSNAGLFAEADRDVDKLVGEPAVPIETEDIDSIELSETPLDSVLGKAETGQQNENSMLFSLANLQAIAITNAPDQGAPDATSTGKDDQSSGLIDIRILSSALSETRGADVEDLISMGGAFSPILTPPKRRVGLAATIVIAATGLAFAAGVAVVLVIALTGSEKEDAIDGQIAMLQKQIAGMQLREGDDTAKIERLKAKLEQGTMAGSVREDSHNKEMEAADKAAPIDKRRYAPSRRSRSNRAATKASSRSRSSSSKSKASASESASPTLQKRKGDVLDDLIGGALAKPAKSSKKKRGSSSSKSSGGSEVKKTLDRSDVQMGMSSVAGRVKSCGRGQRGTITLKVVIGSTGRVISVIATGAFAGTPLGSCAARAVRTAKFPRSQSNLTVRYPFKL